MVGVVLGSPNKWIAHDTRETGYPRPVARLWNGSAYEDFSPDFDVPWEFQADGSWYSISNPIAYFEFYSSTFKSKASFDSTYGSLQGPYQ